MWSIVLAESPGYTFMIYGFMTADVGGSPARCGVSVRCEIISCLYLEWYTAMSRTVRGVPEEGWRDDKKGVYFIEKICFVGKCSYICIVIGHTWVGACDWIANDWKEKFLPIADILTKKSVSFTLVCWNLDTFIEPPRNKVCAHVGGNVGFILDLGG